MLILVASCADYSDAWGPFLTLFQKFWPDCVYERILYSDPPKQIPPELKAANFKFAAIEDRGWITNLREMLVKNRRDETVIVFQEDFFICYPVDSNLIRRLELCFEKSDYDGLRLFPCPGADDEKEVMPGVGTITLNAPYRVSCQLMMWKRKRLIELCDRLLHQNCNKIQQFETMGSTLIGDFKLCGWIRRDHPKTWPISYLCSAIANGKWMQGAVQLCAEMGIPLSKKREIIFADDAQKAILEESYYEWLETCATGSRPLKPVKLKS